MERLKLRLAAAFVLILPIWVYGFTAVPNFTPNVVDPSHYLSEAQVKDVNNALDVVRSKANMMGAVYLVDELAGESIEALAERTFKKWQLGSQPHDNGLLLVVAMKDRKSRFEVGYGLEGQIPDAVAGRVLDGVFRSEMRKGHTKEAIIRSFYSVAQIQSDETPGDVPAEITEISEPESAENWHAGFWAWGIFSFFIWLTPLITGLRKRSLASRLQKTYPEYHLDQDQALQTKNLLPWFLILFFTINPGVFILFGAALVDTIRYIVFLGCPLLAVLYYVLATGKYRSKNAYLYYIERLRQKNHDYIKKGYMREGSPGQYTYTDAYYASPEYHASISSSSSSGFSSSSGGGSSGGGGASSSW